MKPRVLKIATLPPMLDEALHATYEVVEAHQDGTGVSAATADIRALVANGESTVTRQLLEQLPALEVIAVLGVGYDGVDVKAARERGIQVTHTPDVLTDDVADFAMALLLGIARNTGWPTSSPARAPGPTGLLHSVAKSAVHAWASSAWAASARPSRIAPRPSTCRSPTPGGSRKRSIMPTSAAQSNWQQR